MAVFPSYNPFTHFWSLGIEEQFYFVYPLLFVFVTKFFKNKSHQVSVKLFTSLLIFFAFLSFTYYISGIDSNKLLYYSPFARAWELLLGCISAASVRLYRTKFSPNFLLKISFTLKITFVAFLLLLTFDIGGYFFNLIMLLMSFSSILYFDAFSASSNQSTSINSVRAIPQKIFLFIGNSSFSAYIIHWPLLLFFKIFFIFQGNYFKFDVSYIVSLSILTFFSYLFVEKKFTLDSNYKYSITPFFPILQLSCISGSYFYSIDLFSTN